MHPILNATIGWGAAAITALLFIGLGRFLARLFGLQNCGIAVAFVAGSWVVSILLMSLGFSDALTTTEVAIGLSLAAPFAAHGLWKGPRSGVRIRWPGYIRVPFWIVAGVLVIWTLPYLVHTLLPDTDWDSAMYHRPAAQRFLERGVTSTDAFRAQMNFPGAVPLLYAGFMALDVSSAMTPFNLIGIVLLALAVYEVGVRFLSVRGALWAVALMLTTNIVMKLGIDQRSDSFLALFFFACFQLTLEFWKEPKRVGLLPLLGMAMGMAIGTKLTGLLAVGMFGGATFVVMLMRRPQRFLPWFLFAMVCLAVPGGFWPARNAILLDDPIYPFLNGLQYEDVSGELRAFYPNFEPFFERAEKPPDKFLKDLGGKKEPSNIFNLWDVFRNYERYQNKKHHWLQPLLFLAFFLPFLDRRPKYLWLCAAGCVCFVALGARAHLVRYALAACPMLALGAAAFITHARVRRSKHGPLVVWGLILLTCGIAVNNSRVEWIRLAKKCPLDYLLAVETPYAWKVRRGYNGDQNTSIAAHGINTLIWDKEMPRDSLILMVAEAKVELFICATIPDLSAEVYLWQTELLMAGGDYKQLRNNLRRFRITHIFISLAQISWAITELKMDSKLQNRDYLRFGAFHALRFCQEYGVKVFSDESAELYRLK